MRTKETHRRNREGGPSLSFFNRCAVFGESNLDDAIQALAEGDFFFRKPEVGLNLVYGAIHQFGGAGRVWGQWCIKAVEEMRRVFEADGTPRRLDFTIVLVRFDEGLLSRVRRAVVGSVG